MKKLDRILAAVDFSQPARAAFARAVALSRAHGAELLAVLAVPADRAFKWEARERIALVDWLRETARRAGVEVKVSVQQGDPAALILLHAQSRGADLIVIGTNARSGFDRFRFGSVAETVALRAAQPVLVVPAGEHAEAAAEPFTNVVVAVALGDGSREAIAQALSIAGENGRLTVVHVVPGMAHAGTARYMYHLMEPEYHRQLARDARKKIAALIPATAGRSRKIHVRVVTGDPSAEISRVAAEAGGRLTALRLRTPGIGARSLPATAAADRRAVDRAPMTASLRARSHPSDPPPALRAPPVPSPLHS